MARGEGERPPPPGSARGACPGSRSARASSSGCPRRRSQPRAPWRPRRRGRPSSCRPEGGEGGGGGEVKMMLDISFQTKHQRTTLVYRARPSDRALARGIGVIGRTVIGRTRNAGGALATPGRGGAGRPFTDPSSKGRRSKKLTRQGRAAGGHYRARSTKVASFRTWATIRGTARATAREARPRGMARRGPPTDERDATAEYISGR